MELHRFTEEEFKRFFTDRGIRPEVVKDAFYRYHQNEIVDLLTVVNARPSLEAVPVALEAAIPYAVRCSRLATKAPGMMLVRFPVDEGEPIIFNEQRPDWAIWLGDPHFPPWMGGIPKPHVHGKVGEDGKWVGIFKHPDDRAAHVDRARVAPPDVFRGMTLDEYRHVADMDSFGPPNYGGDHFGDDTDEPHLHVDIAKYVFTPNEREWVDDPDGPHDHADYKSQWRRMSHETFNHTESGEPVDEDQRSYWSGYKRWIKKNPEGNWAVAQVASWGEHEHHREEDVTHYAARLSWHPWKRAERWRRRRVMFAMEGCLKESSLASAGEATVSCPSITLWRAPELKKFAEHHLKDKVTWVITDSDWDPAVRRLKDDKVISQALLLQDTLRRYGVDARVAAPPHPWDAGCIEDHEKHGVDEHLGPCNRLGADDLLQVTVTPRSDLHEWLTEKRKGEVGRWEDGVDRDLEVLTWLSRYTANGRCRLSIRSIARNIQYGLDVPEEETLDDEPIFEAKVEQVRAAVHSLAKYGAVMIGGDLKGRRGKGKLKNKTSHHYRRTKREWTGWIELASELRSDVDTRPIGPEVPRRVSMSGRRGVVPPNTVYVGRYTAASRTHGLALERSPFANPFRVGHEARDNEHAVQLYREVLFAGELPVTVAGVRSVLRGRDVACWCKDGEPCHGDLLLRLANPDTLGEEAWSKWAAERATR